MTITVIITVCTLLLIAYVFDLTASKTKIPAVMLLLFLGWVVRQISEAIGEEIPDLSGILPILGTIGLVLIVLEGSLELEINKSKTKVILKSFLVAFISIFAFTFLLASIFYIFGNSSLRNCLINAIPFAVISSAIAIPSVKNLTKANKEFIVYESSMSDILGVLFFNFMILNDTISLGSFGNFGLQLVIIAVISFIATLGLSLLLNKIDHHIKFAPIILLVILIYAVSEVYHLPALIFIVLFGLFVGNLNGFKRFKWIQKLNPDELNKEVYKFREITVEAAFLIRSLFFLLFGYLIETAEITNTTTLLWAIAIIVFIYFIRLLVIKLVRFKLKPLVYVAPRGLITILLFFIIPAGNIVYPVNKSLIIQVIILSVVIMMIGMMKSKDEEEML